MGATAIVRDNIAAINDAKESGKELNEILAVYIKDGIKIGALRAAYYRVNGNTMRNTKLERPHFVVTQAAALSSLTTQFGEWKEAHEVRDFFSEFVASEEFAKTVRQICENVGIRGGREMLIKAGVQVTERRLKEWLRGDGGDEGTPDQKQPKSPEPMPPASPAATLPPAEHTAPRRIPGARKMNEDL